MSPLKHHDLAERIIARRGCINNCCAISPAPAFLRPNPAVQSGGFPGGASPHLPDGRKSTPCRRTPDRHPPQLRRIGRGSEHTTPIDRHRWTDPASTTNGSRQPPVHSRSSGPRFRYTHLVPVEAIQTPAKRIHAFVYHSGRPFLPRRWMPLPQPRVRQPTPRQCRENSHCSDSRPTEPPGPGPPGADYRLSPNTDLTSRGVQLSGSHVRRTGQRAD